MFRRTRPVHRSALLALTTLLLAAAGASVPGAATAEQRLETIDLPSTKGFVDIDGIQLNRTTSLQANVLLPDGYDAQPGVRWPVLFLLPGVGDNMGTWADPKKGDIRRTAKDFPGIIVMPEAGRGYLTDWWRGGQRTNPQWERYHLEEVVPAIESRYRIAPGRSNHAIGGVSMGGFGGVLLAGQLPSYFGTALSMSGLLDLQAPDVVSVLPLDIGSPYAKIWGQPNGPYARVHNPLRMIDNVVGSRVYVSTGNGTPLGDVPFSITGWTSGSLAEFSVWKQSLKWSARARLAGVQVQYSGHAGIHDWPYWRRELPRALRWGVFGPTPAADAASHRRWTYRTMAPRGNAWGIGYTFASRPYVIETFTRDGQTLSGTGAGTVTISPGAADADASGAGSRPDCAFTATLPFTRTLPAGC